MDMIEQVREAGIAAVIRGNTVEELRCTAKPV